MQAGNTALHWAAYRGYIDTIDTLLNRGAKPNVRNNVRQIIFDKMKCLIC
jgi:ankyrin repeat protein